MVESWSNICSREDCSISAIVTLCWRYHHLYLYNLLLKIVPSLVTEDGAFCHMRKLINMLFGLFAPCLRLMSVGFFLLFQWHILSLFVYNLLHLINLSALENIFLCLLLMNKTWQFLWQGNIECFQSRGLGDKSWLVGTGFYLFPS